MNPLIFFLMSFGLRASHYSIFGNSVALDGIAPGVYVSITPEQAKQMMEENPEMIVIDVRIPADYSAEHIPGAINIPLQELVDRVTTEMPDRDTPMIVYCKGGHRSRQGAQVLASIGYKKIYNMGSMVYWPYDFITEFV